jgi:hypothetical protein
MQLLLQSTLLAQLSIHLRFKEPYRRASVSLGTVECSICVPDDGRRVGPIIGTDGNTDAGAGTNSMPLDFEVVRESAEDAIGQRHRVRWLPTFGGDQDELITAQTRHQTALRRGNESFRRAT